MPKSGVESEVIYEGIPASPGIAIAPVHVVARGFSAPEVYEIDELDVEPEQERFRKAVEITKRQLKELQEAKRSIWMSYPSLWRDLINVLQPILRYGPVVNVLQLLLQSVGFGRGQVLLFFRK